MRINALLLAFIGAASLAACGGGSGAYGGTIPTPMPTQSTGPQSNGNIPGQDTISANPVFVDPSSHFTLYFLDSDTANGSGCTGGCITEWPPMTAAARSQGQGNMAVITRSDGTGQQWAYNGHPLYHFSGDKGPDQSNGVYGPWHMAIANPNATPQPGSPPCKNYC
ncbi:MAG: hypothetical protein M3Y21_03310 [Candidatus Eremiobacteraeota bacterium]|nr:hypothetical protein [Candidatus Eremiobacteraeota bacterium]